MKFIFSNWSDAVGHKTSSLELAKISNFLIQAKGFETVLFADKGSIEHFKSVPYNEIHEIKDYEMENIPKSLWSMSKLVSMSKMNEPFLHVDFDLFLFKFDELCLKKNIVCLHSESYFDKNIKILQKIVGIQPEKTLNSIARSYNCGIIGGQNFEFLKKASNEILEYVRENKSHIEEVYSNNLNNKDITIQIMPVLVEQVWMFQLFKFYNEIFYTYLDSDSPSTHKFQNECYIKGFIHFQKGKKVKNCEYTINQFINYFNI